jgi:hypothetical protein
MHRLPMAVGRHDEQVADWVSLAKRNGVKRNRTNDIVEPVGMNNAAEGYAEIYLYLTR